MKKTFVFLGILSLVSVVCSQSSPVGNKLKSINSNEYKGWNQVTVFDSTEVKMEASGLSYINNHKLIKVLNHNGAKENSVFK